MSTLPKPPNIDMPGTVRVIDDTKGFTTWKVLARLPVASEKQARDVARKHGLHVVWLFDQLGNKKLIRCY